MYRLKEDKQYRFLKFNEATTNTKLTSMLFKINVEKFQEISTVMTELEFTDEQISTIYAIVASILNLGETRFVQNDDMSAVIENKEVIENVAELIEVDPKKLLWALINYCVVKDGKAIRKRNSCEEARNARDVLANTLYSRLVDYMVNKVNTTLAIGKQIL